MVFEVVIPSSDYLKVGTIGGNRIQFLIVKLLSPKLLTHKQRLLSALQIKKLEYPGWTKKIGTLIRELEGQMKLLASLF